MTESNEIFMPIVYIWQLQTPDNYRSANKGNRIKLTGTNNIHRYKIGDSAVINKSVQKIASIEKPKEENNLI